jgi:hypothetical protein
MKANEFIIETHLKVDDLFKKYSKKDGAKKEGTLKYLPNLIQLISDRMELEITPGAQDKYGTTVQLDPEYSIAALNAAKPGQPVILRTVDGEDINLTKLEKSPAVTGAGVNLGYIGEISLGVATAVKFLANGKTAGPIEFINLGQKLKIDKYTSPTTGKIGGSKQLSFTGKIKHANGKVDTFSVKILAPGSYVDAFKEFCLNPETIPLDVRGVILSALQYANNEEKIKVGLEKTARDPNINLIQVVSDGISDNKGTKADLVMDIDGERINLLSVKTGASQLGQASGHEWSKQLEFFKLVFGVDASPYEKLWGTEVDDHLIALDSIWQKLVIPKVLRLTGGDSIQNEIALVRSIASGLIRYSNNINKDTGEVEPIDIVKLVVDPNSPGYSMLKIDSRVAQAMEKTNLIGTVPPSQRGINILGRVEVVQKNGTVKYKDITLCRMWSTKSGKTVRTNVAGGPLLDELALVIAPATAVAPVGTASQTNLAQPVQAKKQTTTTTGPAVRSKSSKQSNTTVPAATPVAPELTPQPQEPEKEVAEEQGSWKPYTDKHVSELERMLHLAKYTK